MITDRLNEAWNKLTMEMAGWLDSTVLLLPNLLLSLIVGFLGYLTVRKLQKYLYKLFDKIYKNESISRILSNVSALFLMIALLFIILGILQLDKLLTSLLATAGVLGLAIGLALQEPLMNFFSGIMLSVKDQVNIGDIVETNGIFGTITDIDLKSTIINKPTGQTVTIPNKLVLQNPITNYTYLRRRRVDLECGVSYGDDLDKVASVVVGAIKENVKHLEQLPVEFMFTTFSDSSINFVVRYWIDEVSQAQYLQAKSDGIRAIKRIFDKEGITIPFPIRTLDFGIKGGTRLSKELLVKGNNQNKQSE